ncbi:MAG: hypothetical protein HFACDABA_02534 [Anaerolineales bacterium]|nr:hypothetical protein [Anaerolineales bacterium]
MQAFNCPNCGAALPKKEIKGADLASCEFCGVSFRVPKSLTPEPDMGDLILGADFGSKTMPGWEVVNEELLTFHTGNPSELRGVYKPSLNSYYVLKSSGLLDDFDAGVNLKFIAGDRDSVRAGFYLRFSDRGGYAALVSVLGSYTIGCYKKDGKNELQWEDLLPWTNHTALRAGMNMTNRLRVLCKGRQFRVYLNGALAASFQDDQFMRGKLYLAVAPTAKSSLEIAFSDLQLREAPR